MHKDEYFYFFMNTKKNTFDINGVRTLNGSTGEKKIQTPWYNVCCVFKGFII